MKGEYGIALHREADMCDPPLAHYAMYHNEQIYDSLKRSLLSFQGQLTVLMQKTTTRTSSQDPKELLQKRASGLGSQTNPVKLKIGLNSMVD